MIRIAIIGLGRHAEKYLIPTLLKLANECQISGVVSRDVSRANQLAQSLGVKAYKHRSDIYRDQNIDAVLVANPVGLHYEAAIEALAHGKHVIVEKSLCSTAKHWSELCDTAEERDVTVLEAFMFGFHPQFNELTRMFQSLPAGGPVHISAKFGLPARDPSDIRNRKELGGGALLDVGCYTLAAIRLLTQAIPDSINVQLWQDSRFEVDGYGSASGRCGRTSFSAQWGFGLEYVNEIEVWNPSSRIIASRAFSKPPDLETSIKVQSEGDSALVSIPAFNHFTAMFSHFFAAIHNPELRRKCRTDVRMQLHWMSEALCETDVVAKKRAA